MRVQRVVGVLAVCAVYALSPAVASANGPSEPRTITASVDLPSEDDLIADLLSVSQDKRAAATEYLLKNPAAVNPLYLAVVSYVLWDRGDRLQATFWFYTFQMRTRPWLDHQDSDYLRVRAAANSMLGPVINEWIASDVGAWLEVTDRSAAYEKEIPLYTGRPEALSQAEWMALVQEHRHQDAVELAKVFAPMRDDAGAVEAARRSKGLYVGPLENPGAPLLDAWR